MELCAISLIHYLCEWYWHQVESIPFKFHSAISFFQSVAAPLVSPFHLHMQIIEISCWCFLSCSSIKNVEKQVQLDIAENHLSVTQKFAQLSPVNTLVLFQIFKRKNLSLEIQFSYFTD